MVGEKEMSRRKRTTDKALGCMGCRISTVCAIRKRAVSALCEFLGLTIDSLGFAYG